VDISTVELNILQAETGRVPATEESKKVRCRGWGQGGKMNQALYAHMNNKRKMKKKKKEEGEMQLSYFS
jgi:hypothetical protein